MTHAAHSIWVQIATCHTVRYAVVCGYLLLLCTVSSLARAQAENPAAAEPAVLPAAVRHYSVLEDLHDLWFTETGERYTLPFSVAGEKQLEIRREVFLPVFPRDTMLLWVERLSWSAEVYVNDKLLANQPRPFQPLLVKIPPSALSAQFNELLIRLKREGPQERFWPREHRLGILGRAYLLVPDTARQVYLQPEEDFLNPVLERSAPEAPAPNGQAPADELPQAPNKQQAYRYLPLPELHHPADSDSVIVYPTINTSGDYFLSLNQLKNELSHLRLMGARQVYFPMGLPHSAWPVVENLGLIPVDSIARYIAYYKPYPVEAYPDAPVWVSATGERQPAIRTFLDTFGPGRRGVSRWQMILALAGGILLLVGFRVLAPQTFEQIILGREAFNSLFGLLREPHPLGLPEQLSLLVLRAYLLGTGVGQILIVLTRYELHQALNIINEPGALFALANSFTNQPVLLWLGSVALFLLIFSLQRVLLYTISRFFGAQQFADEISRYRAAGWMPAALLLFVAAFVPVLQGADRESNFPWGWLLAFLLASMYALLTVGKQTLNHRKASSLGKILYICGVELLPLVFLI